jgi:hypothetical protein
MSQMSFLIWQVEQIAGKFSVEDIRQGNGSSLLKLRVQHRRMWTNLNNTRGSQLNWGHGDAPTYQVSSLCPSPVR